MKEEIDLLNKVVQMNVLKHLLSAHCIQSGGYLMTRPSILLYCEGQSNCCQNVIHINNFRPDNFQNGFKGYTDLSG